MRKIAGGVGAAALVVGLGGCWWQPGYDAGQGNWNAGEETVTSGNVDQIELLWDTEVPADGTLRGPVSSGGRLYVVKGIEVDAIDAATGVVAWQHELPPPDVSGVTRQLHGPVIFDNQLVVGAEDWALSHPGGSRYHLSLATGAELGTSGGFTMELAEAGDQLVAQSVARAGITLLTWIDWKYRPINDGGAFQHGFAIAGDRVLWSDETEAVGYSPACAGDLDPFCQPDWRTDLGGDPTDLAAIGAGRAVYVDDTGTVTVVDTATGAVQWTAEVAGRQVAVAGGNLLVGTADGRLVALPAAGCGTATCTPLWEATVGGGTVGQPVAGGDVVYVPSGSTITALALDGCGAATCTPLTTVEAGHTVQTIVVDGGRVAASTTDGHLVAFGLPG